MASGARPLADGGDLRRLRALMPEADVVHVHRGKEHWLAAMANRLIATRDPSSGPVTSRSRCGLTRRIDGSIAERPRSS
jgi:hypothetical protein